MKTIQYMFFALILCLGITSCSKDGDLIYLSPAEGGQLSASDGNVVLSKELNQSIVMSLAWTKVNPKVSNSNVSAPNLLTTTLQASLSSDFSTAVTESSESNQSKAYTGLVFNTLAKNLGAAVDVSTPIYFRLKVSEGNNMEPVYSNTVTVKTTPYLIDMSIGYLLTSKQDATDMKLASPTSNGVYTGFIGATAWYNYFLQEGDGTVWGNLGADNSAFILSSDKTKWNFWYPGQTGCYYTVVDTKKKVWSALYMPSLGVTGDLNGSMVYERAQNEWIYVFNAAAAGSATIKISGTGKQYNYSTATDDANAIDTPLGFGASASTLSFGSSASDITVNIPSTGTCTLILNLNNPKAWSCSVVKGDATPTSVSKYVYLSGIDDGISGSWTFDNYVTLYNESDLKYEGVINVNSKWGYKFYSTKDDWNSALGTASGTSDSGTLSTTGGSIPAPTAGYYLFDVDMKNLTYALTGVSAVAYSGFNNDWSLTAMTPTSTAGEYAASVTINGASPYGAKIVINSNWDMFYGGSNGTLKYKGANIIDDATLATGTYTLTINLITGTYSFAKQ